MKRIKVKLNAIEQGLVFEVAGGRNKANVKAGVASRAVGDSGEAEKHIHGAAGELAFGKVMGKYPDLTVRERGSDAGFDYHIFGETWDIKTTRHKNGKLISPMHKKNRGKQADVYVLVISEFPTMTIVGWASGRDLYSSEIDLGYGPCYGLGQDELRPIDFHWVDLNVARSSEMEWV
jgi:hypothetical protein